MSSLHNSQNCCNDYFLVKFHYCFPPLMMMFWKEDSPYFLLRRWIPNVYFLVKFHYCFPPLVMMFWKEDSLCFLLRRWFTMIPRLLVTPKSLWQTFTVCCTDHCSLLLFISTVHFELCLFKGGCPLCLKQIFSSI